VDRRWGGEKVTLRIESAPRRQDELAKRPLDAFRAQKSQLLEQYCDEIGRDFGTIVRTHGPDCRIFDTEADLRKWLDSPSGGALRRDPERLDEYVRDNFVGTVEQVTEKVAGVRRRGVAGSFVLWFRDFPVVRESRSIREERRTPSSAG